MHRLVIALTALLSLAGVVVVGGYLFLFAAQPDRMSRAVPADASLYATVYLQPSTGQKLNLASLLGRVPGFSDPASLDTKIHEITGRLLSEADLDYEADIRPWLGDQVAVAVEPSGMDPAAATDLLLVGVKDRSMADTALQVIAADRGIPASSATYEGVELWTADSMSWAVLDDLLLVGSSDAAVEAGIDADANRSDSLADSGDFQQAMKTIPADHLGAVYLDLSRAADAAGIGDQLGGYSTAALALVVQPEGLQLAGGAPFAVEAAPSPAREAFALASEPSGMPEWMPLGTQAEAVVFGLSQTLRAIEGQLAEQDPGGEVISAIDQVRAAAALGLGISIDDDLLPLFDRETGIAITSLDGDRPHGQLLLRPADPEAAVEALGRMRGALEDRGVSFTDLDRNGVTITVADLPEVGTIAYAVDGGVIVAALSAADVTAALTAQREGASLAEDVAYGAAWELAGTRGGNEIWVNAGGLVDAAGDQLGVTGDLRDILLQVGAVAMTAPAADDHTEFHIVVTVR